MVGPAPGIIQILNNGTGLSIDVENFVPTGRLISFSLFKPPVGKQTFNLTYFDPDLGSDGGYIFSCTDPKTHILGSDEAGAILKCDPATQKVFWIYPAHKHSDQYIFSTQNRDCECGYGLVWQGHGSLEPNTLEVFNASNPTQYWNIARLN